MNLQSISNRYDTAITKIGARIVRRNKPVTQAQMKGIDWYTKAGDAVRALFSPTEASGFEERNLDTVRVLGVK
jgi:hypothetical protein